MILQTAKSNLFIFINVVNIKNDYKTVTFVKTVSLRGNLQ